MRGEVEIKRDRLKQERYEANKKVIEKAIKITNEKEPQRQGVQGQQNQFERSFTVPSRQRLNIENPLLLEVSLMYLGLKKIKPINREL